MRKIIFLFLFVCSGANSAQLVGSEILLCDNGYSPDNTTCTTYDANGCDASGFLVSTPSTTTFVAATKNKCSISGYKPLTISDTAVAIYYHGAVSGSEITLCDNGYSPNNSTCTTYDANGCDASGFLVSTPSTTTFVAATKNKCSISGYKPLTISDTAVAIYYHGAVSGSEITLCDNGYSPDNTTCTAYQEGDCPAEYYGINAGGTSFAVKNGTCASGYKQYIAEDSCGFELTASTCISFCNKGELTTGVGACSTLCGAGATTFRTSTGLKYPLWATKGITPSLNVGFANGEICYMNLTDEPTSSQSIWFQWDNNKLHATK